MDKGAVNLDFEPSRGGYLPALLRALQINSDSQVLIFSKTSFQASKISPQAPRAVYFNDNVAVGFVHGSDVLEFAASDPSQGVVFYTLDMTKSKTPAFVRRNEECLACHLIPGILNVPGLVVSSVIPTPQGVPRFPGAGLIIDSRTPIEDRWGGWYVTGTTGGMQHRGNAFAPYPDQPHTMDLRNTQNLTSLRGKFDTATYLEPSSDIVALMTLEHQTRMTNLIIRMGWETRIAEESGGLEQARSRLDFVTDSLVSYMLFAGEASIYDPIHGVSTFAQTFSARGPRDEKGRSLRDFDLSKRLFRFPLSYMIYSEVFNSLPADAKQRIYRRLFDVLSGKEQSKTFGPLASEDRQAIREILVSTKPDLPPYWYPNSRKPASSACCN